NRGRCRELIPPAKLASLLSTTSFQLLYRIMSKNGKIVQVIGAVVDAVFPAGSVPEIFDAITIEFTVNGENKRLVLEVQQHLGEGLVRAVAMSSTDGLVRGMAVTGTGAPISVPVGE